MNHKDSYLLAIISNNAPYDIRRMNVQNLIEDVFFYDFHCLRIKNSMSLIKEEI